MKTGRKIISLLLSAVMVLGVCAAGFTTSAEDEIATVSDGISFNKSKNCYEISNYAGLKTFAGIVNGVSNPNNLSNPQSACAILTADIDASASNPNHPDYYAVNDWTPIGNYNHRYTGIFDGGGHKITGLTYNNSEQNYAGLFGYVNGVKNGDEVIGGIVKNVGLEGGSITGKYFVGGVAGYNCGTVANCYNTGDVTGNDFTGGVAGYNEGTVTNCFNTGAVNAADSDAFAGGIAGCNVGEITNCNNGGSATASGSSALAGGVAGYNEGTVTNCCSTGAVTGGLLSGGVAGDNNGTVINSFYNRSTCVIAGANKENNWKVICDGYAGSNVKALTNEEFKDPANFNGTTVDETFYPGFFTEENGEYTSDVWVMGDCRPLLKWAVDAGVNYYAAGDIIKYGAYPQSRVDETEALRAAAEEATWKSYNYYNNTGEEILQGDWMQYADFFLDGEKYRAVYFTEYRRFYTRSFSSYGSYVETNGYEKDTYHYFLYEPVEWRVLNPNEGLIMSETIIDSQPFNYYVENPDIFYSYAFENSSLRQWLNADFYNTAFTAVQKNNIKTTDVDNYSYDSDENNRVNGENTQDKVFLLSYDEALTVKHGFSADAGITDSRRLARGSDYAGCQGLHIIDNPEKEYNHCSPWRLRTFSEMPNANIVHESGKVTDTYFDDSTVGVRPALKLESVKPDAEVSTELYSEIISAGDTIEYGTYPQSKVKDETTLAALNAKLANDGWISYGYYSGTGDDCDGKMAPSDYMKYQDVILDGVKYRAVKFDSYRPYNTGLAPSAGNSYQDENGYSSGTTYWFEFEPLEWLVLDPYEGLVACKTAIDAQPYNNYVLFDGIIIDYYYEGTYYGDADKEHYANEYAASSIRQWLNDDFINTAFSEAQQKNIAVNDNLDISAYDDTRTEVMTASDRIFLLSYPETKSAGYSKYLTGINTFSDYAGCQGITNDNESGWWLRTRLLIVSNTGGHNVLCCHNLNPLFRNANNSSIGVVPALRLQKLESDPTGVPVRKDPEITIDGIVVSYGETVTVTVTIAGGDATGTITVDGNTYDVENGVATFPLTPAAAGQNSVSVEYSGDDNYQNGSAVKDFNVNKAIPVIDMSVSPEQPVYGDSLEVTVALSDGVTGCVKLYVDGNQIDDKEAVNNAVVFTISLINAGEYTFRALYEGNNNYSSCEASVTVNVAKCESKMDVQVKNISYPESETVTVTMYGDESDFVILTLYGIEETYSQKIKDNKAIFNIKGLKPGNYTGTVTYLGDDNHLEKSEPIEFAVSTVCCPLTINYKYADGSPAAPAHTDSIEIFKTYSVDSPAVKGCTPSVSTVEGEMGENDIDGKTVDVIYTPNTYSAKLIVDNEVYQTVSFTYGDQTLDLPAVPGKEGHTGEWESYTLDAEDIEIKAVYTVLDYDLKYIVDDSEYYTERVPYGSPVTRPRTPQRDGYDFSWDKDIPSVMPANDLTFNGVFTAINYTATFVDRDGTVIGTDTFTVADTAIDEPALPAVPGYDIAWSEYAIAAKDITVTAQYTAITYTATFFDENGAVVGTDTFTVEDTKLDEPAAPEKPGYAVSWEEYEITAGDITVNAVYTPVDICPLDNEYHGTSFFGRVIKFIHTVIWKAFRLIGLNVFFKIG